MPWLSRPPRRSSASSWVRGSPGRMAWAARRARAGLRKRAWKSSGIVGDRLGLAAQQRFQLGLEFLQGPQFR